MQAVKPPNALLDLPRRPVNALSISISTPNDHHRSAYAMGFIELIEAPLVHCGVCFV